MTVSARTISNPFAATLWGAAVVGLSLAVGCGGPGGPERFHLSGTVTHDGQPIPAGEIAFEPDSSKGNTGPAAYAPIKDGTYATPSRKGTVGGPHVVRINGSDGKASGESPLGQMLFPEYRTTADLPKESAEQNFDVPK